MAAIRTMDEVVSVPGFGAAHGFTTTALGSMGLTRTPDPDAVMARRARFARAVGFELGRAALAEQVHGAHVHAFTPADGMDGGQSVLRTDALATDVPGQALITFHADCYPLLFRDSRRGVVAAAHAGWRGTLAGIGFAVVRALKDAYGTAPSDLEVLVGPGICRRCYEVGPEVVQAFRERFDDTERYLFSEGARARLDLASAVTQQLVGAGVDRGRIRLTAWCTKEDDRWFSHRGGRPGRFLAAIVAG